MFRDRVDAGRQLAARLLHLRAEDPVVLGLPRGGVPVASEVADALDAPLDVIVVRKLGVPFQPELGMGALGEDGCRVINRDVVRMARVSEQEIAAVEALERVELQRRAERFRRGRPAIALQGRTVVIVDDGIATGSTARAACHVARARGAGRVVLAVPVAPPDWVQRLRADADELICVETPAPFDAVGQWYRNFTQTTDDDVVECLRRHPFMGATPGDQVPPPNGVRRSIDEEVEIPTPQAVLAGHLVVPRGAQVVVLFAHGSGSSRHSPRNRSVASLLNQAGLGTLLFDLLTVEEATDRDKVFDVELLADRLLGATIWLQRRSDLAGVRVGYFGASTGAAAALWAAAAPDAVVSAVVSRGGRPDLAGPRLAEVRAPTLLIVGGLDDVVLDLNRSARSQLRGESRLVVVPGATHLFEEPGTLQRVAELARDWFVGHLWPQDASARGT